jgi:hypothetical protein
MWWRIKMKDYDQLEAITAKLESLHDMTIYPPAKKQQADAIIIEFLEACGTDVKSKEIIKKFLQLYKEIEGEY